MSGPVCAVTGVNGFVGKAIVKRLQKFGWRVIALTHRPEIVSGLEARRFNLGETVAPDIFSDVDVLIHAAYDFTPRNWADLCRTNIVGSEYLLDAAARAEVKKIIYISSMSAFEGCRSDYGRGKLVVEDAVCIRGGLSIRPGMIYSAENGGLAAKIAAVARKFPVIPMIGNGRYPLYTCHIEDLCDLIEYFIRTEMLPNEIITAAHDKPVTLLDLVRAASGGKTRLVIATPWQWIAFGLWLLERFGLRPGFRSDSVGSLVHANPAPDFERIKKLPVKFRPFTEINDNNTHSSQNRTRARRVSGS